MLFSTFEVKTFAYSCVRTLKKQLCVFLRVTHKPAHHMLNVVECLSCVFQWMPCVLNMGLISIITTFNVSSTSVLDIVLFNLGIWKWKRTHICPNTTHTHTQTHFVVSVNETFSKSFKLDKFLRNLSFFSVRVWFCCPAALITAERRAGSHTNIIFNLNL